MCVCDKLPGQDDKCGSVFVQGEVWARRSTFSVSLMQQVGF